MRNLLFLLLGIYFFSCTYKKGKDKEIRNSDTVKHDNQEIQIKDNSIFFVKDTTVIFSIEELSTEGSEVKVKYINGFIRNAIWSIYGETGQSVIVYKFEKDGSIRANEKKYTYKTDLSGVNSDADIHLNTSIDYLLDSTGNVISRIKEERYSDLFKEFKKNIPMKLLDKDGI
jgi:hypothetical protein